MNTQAFLLDQRKKRGLSFKDVSQAIGISEKHAYDLESYENAIEDTLNIEQIYLLSSFLNTEPSRLCKNLQHCHITVDESYSEIKRLIQNANQSIDILSEHVGWNLQTCAESKESIKRQPIMFFKDLANWFKVKVETIMPNLN